MMFTFTKVLIQVLKTSFQEFGSTTNISVTVTFTDKDTGVIDCPLVDDTFTIFSRSIYGKEIESLDSITTEYKDKPAKLVICDGPTKIGDGAFEGCSGLSSVTIPRSVTTIGERAFSGCSGLSCVGIPRSVTTIGERAFSGCSGLSSITIGRTVTTIGDSVFEGCYALSAATKLILMCTLEYLNEENRYQSLFGCENTTISVEGYSDYF
jgi:hypothetical protein